MSVQTVEIGKIRTSPAALREVQDSSEEFLGIVESMRQRGFMGSILARPAKDPETGEELEDEYELIDGLQRYTAAKRVGLSHINIDVQDMNEGEVLEAQIMMNVHRVETKPREYAAQLLRIMGLNPTWTSAELAEKLGKSQGWLAKMLRLNKIDNEQINALINEGKIPLSNAYALAKLPPEEQGAWVEEAQIDNNGVFVPKIEARVKEIRDERRKGKDAAPPTFTPVQHMRKLKEIRDELETGASMAEVLAHTPAESVEDAVKLTLQWVLNVDPKSVESQKEAWDAKQAEKAEARRLKEEEKQRKKLEEAKAEAAKIEAELDGKGEEIDD